MSARGCGASASAAEGSKRSKCRLPSNEPALLAAKRAAEQVRDNHTRYLNEPDALVVVHFMHYNFCKIHTTLRVTPAMAAGVTTKLWEIEDIVALID